MQQTRQVSSISSLWKGVGVKHIASKKSWNNLIHNTWDKCNTTLRVILREVDKDLDRYLTCDGSRKVVLQEIKYWGDLLSPVEAATEQRNFPGYNSIWQIWLQPGPFPQEYIWKKRQKPTKDGPGESKPPQSLWLNSSIFFPLQRSQSLIFTNWYIPAPHMNLRKLIPWANLAVPLAEF